MIRLTKNMLGKSRTNEPMKLMPSRFNLLNRPGENHTHALHAARDEMAKEKVKTLKYVYGRVARIEAGGRATVDIALKRRIKDHLPFADHILPIVACIRSQPCSTGDLVILENKMYSIYKRDLYRDKGFGLKYENLHQEYMNGNPEPGFKSPFGGRYGWGGNPSLAYQRQNFEARQVSEIPNHYQPHGHHVFQQNRLGEKASAVAAVYEVKEKSMYGISKHDKKELDLTSYAKFYNKTQEVYYSVKSIVQHAGHHVCPLNRCRVAGLEYIKPHEKYEYGKLSYAQSKQHNKLCESMVHREWQPDYFFEVSRGNLAEIELHHELDIEVPNLESRRLRSSYTQPKSIYDPNLEVSYTHINMPKTVDHGGKIHKSLEFLNYNQDIKDKSSLQGKEEQIRHQKDYETTRMTRYYNPKMNNKVSRKQQGRGYYRNDEIEKKAKDIVNMSNRVTEKRVNPHDKMWKIR